MVPVTTEHLSKSLEKWDLRFLRMAREAASWSYDPSTKCGAVIVNGDNDIIATGYNGFPRNTSDSEELYADREKKYQRIIHAEMNAILRARRFLKDHTLYTWPFMPCDRCSPHIIQSGISRCVAPLPSPYVLERWEAAINFSTALFAEAGVELTIYDPQIV